MAISETVLGPNSSVFNFQVADTPATIIAAMDTYITSKGWSMYDTAAPQGLTIGRVYRALQDGSTTVYKYVGISLAAGQVQLKTYESWNSATHVGLNEGTWSQVGGAAAIPGVFSMNTGTDASFYLFVNPKWLAIRTRTTTLTFSEMRGAFEYRKDFGELDTIPSVIFITSTSSAQPSTTTYNMFGTCRSASGAVSQTCSTLNNYMTPYGCPTAVSGTFTHLASLVPTTNINAAVTITAVEMAGANQPTVARLKGRIMALKVVYGSTIWNDMDLAQITLDADYFQSNTGTITNHHYVHSGNFRYLIPV